MTAQNQKRAPNPARPQLAGISSRARVCAASRHLIMHRHSMRRCASAAMNRSRRRKQKSKNRQPSSRATTSLLSFISSCSNTSAHGVRQCTVREKESAGRRAQPLKTTTRPVSRCRDPPALQRPAAQSGHGCMQSMQSQARRDCAWPRWWRSAKSDSWLWSVWKAANSWLEEVRRASPVVTQLDAAREYRTCSPHRARIQGAIE